MNKILDKTVLDSEIIQEVESLKSNDPKFRINLIRYNNSWSFLMVAVLMNRKELVEYLLLSVHNINVNYIDKHGEIVLHFCRDNSILKLLLDCRDLDVNIQDNFGESGLHYLCFWGHESYVKELLLDARVNTSIRNNMGKTARDKALERGYSDIAKILRNSRYTTLLLIPNASLCRDIARMIIEEYI